MKSLRAVESAFFPDLKYEPVPTPYMRGLGDSEISEKLSVFLQKTKDQKLHGIR
ncbi:hypothetical protein [Comamonas sp. JUb58]|uniref:hypothetical protein n=1 Tax=Comamonas sp. JUb58 TaxID=2485114 RepID=UPI0014151956|nr:hypothetical protein [Comamonas sp. JUb58]